MGKHSHIGSSLDDFLKEEGTFEETRAIAIQEVLAWQISGGIKKTEQV